MKFIPLVFALVFGWSQCSIAGPIEQLSEFARATTSLSGEFEQWQFDRTGKPIPRGQTSGTVAMQRPGKFRWQIVKPAPQLIVADGQRLWVYDEDLKQVTVKKQSAALAGSPAAFLLGAADLTEAFTLKPAAAQDGLEWVEAVPKAKDSGVQHLRIGLLGTEVRRMEWTDALGHKARVDFRGLRRNGVVDAALFAFSPPKGVDVVGE